jgi:nitrite reductase (NADH) small subunit
VIRVCGVEDVPLGEGRAVAVAGKRIALFRTEEGWFALDATCPHSGGPLADGIVARRTVICPLHERRFDLATGEERSSGNYCVAAHQVEVRGDDVYLDAFRGGAAAANGEPELTRRSRSRRRAEMA